MSTAIVASRPPTRKPADHTATRHYIRAAVRRVLRQIAGGARYVV